MQQSSECQSAENILVQTFTEFPYCIGSTDSVVGCLKVLAVMEKVIEDVAPKSRKFLKALGEMVDTMELQVASPTAMSPFTLEGAPFVSMPPSTGGGEARPSIGRDPEL